MTANQTPKNYWARGIIQTACSFNLNPNNVRAIVRYGTSTAEPTTTGPILASECRDEERSKLVPWVSNTVGPDSSGSSEPLITDLEENAPGGLNKWKLTAEDMVVDKGKPTLLSVLNGQTTFQSDDNVRFYDTKNQWVYWVVDADRETPGSVHPMHLHGHDFYVLAQAANATWDSSTPLQTNNPIRRDTVFLPDRGYVVIAFLTDNPGVW